VFGAEVSHIFALVHQRSAPVPKYLGYFGTKVHGDTSDPELNDALSVAFVLRNVDPLYIRYSNGMEVFLEND